MKPLFAAVLIASSALAGSAAAEERIYSYDSADDVTKRLVGSGLTFVFDKGLMGMRISEILSTEARARLLVEPVWERDLGARLDKIIPAGTGAGEIYQILDKEQGPGLIRAFCAGSSKGWLVLSPLKARRGLIVHALGDNPAGGPARVCATLRFSFRGEWKAPQFGAQGPNMQTYNQRPPF